MHNEKVKKCTSNQLTKNFFKLTFAAKHGW